MKRIFALLFVCLILCGCSNSNIFTPNKAEESTEATVAPLLPAENYVEGTAMVVKFDMGAQFEMLLDSYHAVLEVKALNEAGEALLADIAPAGSYRNAIETILDAANNQAMLEDKTVITITANEVIADTWNVGSHNILTWPVENYAKTIEANATCKVNAPGPYFDDASYPKEYTYTRDDGDRTTTLCYSANPYLPQEMDCCVYDNGEYEEFYYVQENVSYRCIYHVDGKFSFWYTLPLSNGFYCLRPDGTMWGDTTIRDEAGNLIRQTYIDEDGAYSDYYYENGNDVKSISLSADGCRSETTYYENGAMLSYLEEKPDGSRVELEYFENGMPKWGFEKYTDGSSSEYDYYENGNLKREFACYPDGSTYEQHYDENGFAVTAPEES